MVLLMLMLGEIYEEGFADLDEKVVRCRLGWEFWYGC
jgi:hypothetical protein